VSRNPTRSPLASTASDPHAKHCTGTGCASAPAAATAAAIQPSAAPADTFEVDEPLRPLFSSRADDPEAAAAIEAFLVGLAERIDALQDAEGRGDHAQIARAVARLAADARGAGYEALAGVAREIGEAADAEKSDEVHRGLVELTGLSVRVRMGHRGAV
jgi:hypothetical protein